VPFKNHQILEFIHSFYHSRFCIEWQNSLISFSFSRLSFDTGSMHFRSRLQLIDGTAPLAGRSRFLTSGGEAVATIALTVTDTGDGGGSRPSANCTLRDAIAAAASGDTITFDATVFATPQTILLASELAIDKNLTIQGPGANLLTINGNNAVRVFNIGSIAPAINVTLSGL
jgi:hypothetical protein